MGNLFSSSRPQRSRSGSRRRKQRGGSSMSLAHNGSSATNGGAAAAASVGYHKAVTTSVSDGAITTGQQHNDSRHRSTNPQNGTTLAKHRRSSLKMTLKRAYSSSSSNVFTDDRRQLVQITWKEIVDRLGKLSASLSIFTNLFRTCPELLAVFHLDRSTLSESKLDRLEPSTSPPPFVRHANVFANTLDLAVRNAFELETEVGPLLVMFGRRHCNKHGVQFRNEYLTRFAQAISDFVDANLSETFANNPEVAVGWRLFISYLIHKVKEGYDLESMQARKHSTTMPVM